MKKLLVAFYSIFLLGLSFYGLYSNQYYLEIFMNLSQPFMIARVLLVVVLLAYAFVPQVRLYATRNLLASLGLILLVTGVFTTYSPSILGQTTRAIFLGDTFAMIEGGILAALLSAELPARRTRYLASSFQTMQRLLHVGQRKPAYPAHPVKVLKTQFLYNEPYRTNKAV